MDILGTIVSDNGGKFFASINDKIVECISPKKIKLCSKLVVGDIVELSQEKNVYLITKILDRKNVFIRPRVANISQIVIVIAPIPATDFVLVDKLLVLAKMQNIRTVLCVNKIDLKQKDFQNSVFEQYSGVVDKLIFVSSKQNEVLELFQELKGNISIICGQSAVGKSSLINSIMPNLSLIVGEVSPKIQRGKNTTRDTRLYKIQDNTFVIDSPGFSMLTIDRIQENDLKYYYPEFKNNSCYYTNCNHITEPNTQCSVKKQVENGSINFDRYSRYVSIFNEIKSSKKY